MEQGKPMHYGWFYNLIRGCIQVVLGVWLRVEQTGTENVPLEGPLIVASNHASNLDPLLLGGFCPRKIEFLAKEELFRIPVLGKWILPALHAHPLQRAGSDRKTLKMCIDLVRSGAALVVFPEGTRTPNGQLQPAKAGAALIAGQAKAQLLPVYIDGTFKALPRGRYLPRPHKVRIHYGKPFSLDVAEPVDEQAARHNRHERSSELIMEKIAQTAR